MKLSEMPILHHLFEHRSKKKYQSLNQSDVLNMFDQFTDRFFNR